jgi:hypothetical protein
MQWDTSHLTYIRHYVISSNQITSPVYNDQHDIITKLFLYYLILDSRFNKY